MSGNTYIKSFTHLKDKPNEKQALEMLKRIASLVKPIMRAHNWVLPVLSEFFPTNPGLLGMSKSDAYAPMSTDERGLPRR